jgi:hypothetical protein
VKIRGCIEVEEIEAALAQHPAVASSVVIARPVKASEAGSTVAHDIPALLAQLRAMEPTAAQQLLSEVELTR